MQNGVKKEGRAHYSIWLNGELVGNASNPTAAAAKFEKEVGRAQMNAQRDASNAAWEAKQAAKASAQFEYSKSQAQLEMLCPDFYAL